MDEQTEHSELVEAYRATSYRGKPRGEPDWSLRLDEPAPVDGPIAYITADNPGSRRLSDDENTRRRRRLETELREASHSFFPGRSVADEGDWPDEYGFWVRGVDRREAREIAAGFDQNAIVFVDDGVAELVFCA